MSELAVRRSSGRHDRLRYPACLRLAAAAALAAAAGSASAGAGDSRAAWTPNDISVTQTLAGQERAGTRFEVGDNGDARIEVSLTDSGDGSVHTAGTILLIGGRWMLTRGFAPPPGKAVAALDVAALNSQLVIVLLTALLPEGPPAPGAPVRVHFAEKAKRIRIATASATGEYGAPWSVEGTVSAPAADAPTSYRLSFTYSDHGHPTTVVFAGNVGNSKPPVQFPDSMKLSGWSIRRIGAASASGAASPSGAGPPAHKPATVGELRELQ